MKKPELIILAGSAGSFQVIFKLINALPANFLVSILIVIHRGKTANHNIEDLWNNASKILVKEINDKDEIKKSTIYLCPPDYHLLIEKEKVFSLDVSEPIMFSRPSIDLTMQSASAVYKDKLLAILFSGANRDGAKGMLEVKNQGGETIVQNPEEAEVETMPLAAISLNACTQILKIKEIENLLLSLVG